MPYLGILGKGIVKGQQHPAREAEHDVDSLCDTGSHRKSEHRSFSYKLLVFTEEPRRVLAEVTFSV